LIQQFGEGTYTERRKEILSNINRIREQSKMALNGEQRAQFAHALKYEIEGLKALNYVEEDMNYASRIPTPPSSDSPPSSDTDGAEHYKEWP
jgi:hypothetical protein